ncbi:MAG: FAD-binding oxidoreductase [Proteobacteria bacterium]|nr:FAD-binding oxidoreductase [Pseudomonadota bacterium]
MADTTPSLISRLTKALGDKTGKYVLTEGEAMAPYLTDWRKFYAGEAVAVVLPATTDEVASIVAIANEAGCKLIPQGGNTGLCGGATPDSSPRNIVISLKRMNRVRQVDAVSRSITVEAGCTLGEVKAAAAHHNLLFPLDLAARDSCHIGGNLSTNAGGLNVLRYGTARAQTLGIEVVLPDGRVLDLLSTLLKDNTGYSLRDLFIGAEGTLGIITAATLKLFPIPTATATAFVGLHDIAAGVSLLHTLQSTSEAGVVACELIPQIIIDHVRACYPDVVQPLANPPPFSLLIELAGNGENDTLGGQFGETLNEALEAGLVVDATIANSEGQRQELWRIRELVPAAEIQAGDVYKSDVAVPISRLAEFYEEAAVAAKAICEDVRVFAFGHIGDGNLHYNFAPPKGGDAVAFAKHFAAFDDMLVELLAKYGGSISAEHGIGQKKRDMLLAHKPSAALDVMRAIKHAIDPKGMMNPGKIMGNTIE